MTARCLLAATDFSACARAAAERAALLCAESGAVLQLLHVSSLPGLETFLNLLAQDQEAFRDALLEEARQDLADFATQISRKHAVTARAEVRPGNVAEAILAAAEDLSAEMIVLGARGASWVKDRLFGATVERVLGRTRRPVLAVETPPRAAYRDILVPVDFSAHSLPALRLASALAPQAEVTLLHAYELPYERKLHFAGVADWDIAKYTAEVRQHALENLDHLAKQSAAEHASIRCEIAYGPAARCILEYAASRETDLIVLGKHGRNRLEDWFLGSVTRHVLSEARCDVLISNRTLR